MEMKRVNLIYFSGTGGTARVANAFERSFASRSVAVSRTELKGAADPSLYGDLLVLLFPVYAFNAPKPVDEWLKKIKPVQGRPAVVISVSGGGDVSPNTACRVKTIRSL
jgi:flavodoxin